MERPKEKLLFLLFLFALPFLSLAQRPITGVVKNATNGAAMEGVSVLKNKVPTTATNANGEFQVTANVGDSLTFTAIGFKPFSQVVDARNIMEIQL